MDWRLFQWVNTVQQRTTWAQGPLRLYGALVVNQLVGHLVLRPRPYVTHSGFTSLWVGRVTFRSRVIISLLGRRLRRPCSLSTGASA